MSIAAASILAKVSRDHYMMEMAQTYPEYAFEKHKGYEQSSTMSAFVPMAPVPSTAVPF